MLTKIFVLLLPMLAVINCQNSSEANATKTYELAQTAEAVPTVIWTNETEFLNMIISHKNSTQTLVIDSRNSNEFNGWSSFEKSDEEKLKGHVIGSSNFDTDWINLFDEVTVEIYMKTRLGLTPKTILSVIIPTTMSPELNSTNSTVEFENTTTPQPVKRIIKPEINTIIIYDTKLERLELMRDFLLRKFKFSSLYLFKMIDKSKLADILMQTNNTHLFVSETFYDFVVPPEYLYSVILNTNSGSAINSSQKAFNGYFLFDVSYGDADKYYNKGHIPTSVHLDTNEIEEPPVWNRKNDTELIALVARLGIPKNNSELVIVYGNPDPMAAYRAAVVLKAVGVQNVRVLNGGYNSWLRKNFPIEKKPNFAVPAKFDDSDVHTTAFEIAPMKQPNYIVDLDFVMDIVQNWQIFSERYSLIDIRSWDEFIGDISGYDDLKAKGRIPGAVWGKAGSNVNQLEDYRNPDLTMRSPADIRKMWDELGVDYKSKHLIFYCGSGWRAAEVLFYADLMGLEKVSLFDGGWYEWSSNPNNTFEIGLPLTTESEMVSTSTNIYTPSQIPDEANTTTSVNHSFKFTHNIFLMLTLAISFLKSLML